MVQGAGRGFDAVVVGSGFGGAVAACRLAEAGYRVLVLERGRRWKPEDYPRGHGDAWVWDQEHPERNNGWFDLRWFRNMAVAQGAGVGGGSLVYANILVNATRDLFEAGWPPEITYEALEPHYDTVVRMMNVQRVPENQEPERMRLMRAGAQAVGYADRFRKLDLAVTFDDDWRYDLPDPHHTRHSKQFTNEQGRTQGTCIHLGNCDIGCEVQAKNTLDLNYLARAENCGADIRPLHMVRAIEPAEGGGYDLHLWRLDGGHRERAKAHARIVILAAGSLGSTELLLRSRDEHRTLPDISPQLGGGWSSNGDFVTPAIHPDRDVSPTRGPTITSAIDFLGDNNHEGHHFFVEDGGFPDAFGEWMSWLGSRRSWWPRDRALRKAAQYYLRQRDPARHLMPWFAQARDAADGEMSLRKRWWLFGSRKLDLDWRIRESKATMDDLVSMHERLSRATGGTPLVPATWTLASYLVTPHPLGGCPVGRYREEGVVDHAGEVFDYPNLFVMDGAVLPEALGLNPSKTIAALAERNVAMLIEREGR